VSHASHWLSTRPGLWTSGVVDKRRDGVARRRAIGDVAGAPRRLHGRGAVGASAAPGVVLGGAGGALGACREREEERVGGG
jgi:hypothetical protein